MENKEYISIDESSRIPKYKQIIDSIKRGINDRKLLMGDKILSINGLSEKYNLSRDTVEKAYNFLRSQNIIVSVKGKGYYVSKTDLAIEINVLFILNKLSTYKMHIFNAFVETLGKASAKVDLDIYHCEVDVFKNIVEKKKDLYDYFVIMPHFRNDGFRHVGCPPEIEKCISEIPSKKLIILDREIKSLSSSIGMVVQDFTMDIYNALKSGLDQLSKYRKVILVYPQKAIYPYPQEIVFGFKKFCRQHKFDYEILDEIYDSMELQIRDLYITIQEEDLVNLVKQVRDRHYKLGEDIGIISYNDTPLKELLGISVITTDFREMGKLAGEMILKKEFSKIKNKFNMVNRFSA